MDDPLNEALRFAYPLVREAAVRAAEQLSQLGVRYALAGGLALGVHGYIRATTDVDFLVGEEAFEHHGEMVTYKPGIPIEIGGIRIDYLSPVSLNPQLEQVLDHPMTVGGLPVVPVEVLIYMKLIAKRRRDMADIVELINAGADVKRVEAYLAKNDPTLLPAFEALADEALNQ
jgi:hypothetical protein